MTLPALRALDVEYRVAMWLNAILQATSPKMIRVLCLGLMVSSVAFALIHTLPSLYHRMYHRIFLLSNNMATLLRHVKLGQTCGVLLVHILYTIVGSRMRSHHLMQLARGKVLHILYIHVRTVQYIGLSHDLSRISSMGGDCVLFTSINLTAHNSKAQRPIRLSSDHFLLFIPSVHNSR
jgi:hypothetical protein